MEMVIVIKALQIYNAFTVSTWFFVSLYSYDSLDRRTNHSSHTSDTGSIDRKARRSSHGSEGSERRKHSSQTSDSGDRDRRRVSQSSDVFLPAGTAKVIPQVTMLAPSERLLVDLFAVEYMGFFWCICFGFVWRGLKW